MEILKKCPKVKPIKSTLKTENETELIDRFTQYIQQNNVRSKLKGNVLFNSRSDIIDSMQNK